MSRSCVGRRYGKLLVLERGEYGPSGYVYECRCDCGDIVSVVSGNLKRGYSSQCRCHKKERVSLVAGERVPLAKGGESNLVYVKEAEAQNGARYVTLRCECGNEFDCRYATVRGGKAFRCPECQRERRQVRLQVEKPVSLSAGGPSRVVYLGEAGWVHSEGGERRYRKIHARCECGDEFDCRLDTIRSGLITTCQKCGVERLHRDLTGQCFGRWTVLRKLDERSPGQSLVFECRCDCGTVSTVPGSSLTCGNSRSCGCLASEELSKRAGSNWEPGTKIGVFTIIERVEPPTKRGSLVQYYRVIDGRDRGKEKVMAQPSIRRLSTELGYFKEMCCKRFRAILATKGIQKTRSATRTFTYQYAEIQEALGDRPGRGYALDHICPLSLAETEDEVLALFALENLQWLPHADNSSKNARWTPEGARLHKKLLGRPWPEEKKSKIDR